MRLKLSSHPELFVSTCDASAERRSSWTYFAASIAATSVGAVCIAVLLMHQWLKACSKLFAGRAMFVPEIPNPNGLRPVPFLRLLQNAVQAHRHMHALPSVYRVKYSKSELSMPKRVFLMKNFEAPLQNVSCSLLRKVHGLG
eukprot:2707526-Amphidinium_carterae.2